MRAITVAPGIPNSARLDDVPEPSPADGAVLVRALALGVCSTDREIVSGRYGLAPAGEPRLILGHESLGYVEDAPGGCGVKAGDLVVGIVRRPDPVPCSACAAGEWDMCRNGKYTERGIKERHGFGAERFRLEPEFTVRIAPGLGRLGVLVEPASILAKAWDHTQRIGGRARGWQPQSALITGAGPIGVLAALMGVERNLDVHVFDRNTDGPKPALVRDLGATYHSDAEAIARLTPDLIMECTGVPVVIRRCLGSTAASGIICLVGVSADNVLDVDVGKWNRTMVLDNAAIFGTVNANRRHYEMAADALARADHGWLRRLMTRCIPLDRFEEAFEYRPGDIKVVIDFPA